MENEKEWHETRDIKITCKAAGAIEYSRLLEGQGKLKTLHKADYERLKERILRLGFHQPITVWMYKNKPTIINGHQRLRTIKTMVESDGYRIGNIPVNMVSAANWNEAKRKILALTSTYGKTSKEGLLNFLKDVDINPRLLLEDVKIGDFDLVDWYETYFAKKDEPDALDLGGDDVPLNTESVNPEESIMVPSGHVRMMQMVLETSVAERFSKDIEILKVRFGTNNVSDTVLNAIKEVFHENGKTNKAKNSKGIH